MSTESLSSNEPIRVEDALEACLSQLKSGASLQECLAAFPSLQEQLEPLLSLAVGLQALRQEPPSAALRAGRQRVLQEAIRLRSAEENARPRLRLPAWLTLQPTMWRGVAAAVVASLLFVVVLGGGAVAASANSLPGDRLYAVKRISEEVRLLLTFDQHSKALVQQQLDEVRRDEAQALAATRRVAEVSFRGVVEGMQDDRWTVSGVQVALSDRTEVEGDVVVGTLVQAHVRSLSDGTLLALRIEAQPQPAGSLPLSTATPTEAAPTPAPATATSVVVQAETPIEPTVTTSPPTATATHTLTLTCTATNTPLPPTPEPPRPVKVRFVGRIQSIEPGAWVVDGQLVRLDAATKIGPAGVSPEVGAMATVVAEHTEDGGLLALEITVEPVAPAATEEPYEFQGLIQRFGATEWVVGGNTLLITPDTVVENQPQIGLLAEVKARRRSDGSLVAVRILVRLPTEVVQFEGIIQSLSPSTWVVEGATVRIDHETQVTGAPAVGLQAEVEGLLLPDGSVLARRIMVLEPATAVPTAATSPTPAPTPTATEEPARAPPVASMQGEAGDDPSDAAKVRGAANGAVWEKGVVLPVLAVEPGRKAIGDAR